MNKQVYNRANQERLKEFFTRYIKDNPIKEEEPIRYLESELSKVKKKDPKFDKISKLMRDKCCYFCGFDKVINKHHIIDRALGGNDSRNNLLRICPNHHWMIHLAEYVLKFWDGYLFLINKNDEREIIFPHIKQWGYRREKPKEPIIIYNKIDLTKKRKNNF